MTAHWSIGRKEKLPRGSYFYIQVGHRFYAGQELVHKDVERTRHTESPSRNLAGRFSWPYGPKRNWRHNLWERAKRNMPIPGYLQDKKVTTTYRVPTGECNVLLTDDLTKVKKFRRREQADRACERVEAMYKGFDVKVSVKLQEGV